MGSASAVMPSHYNLAISFKRELHLGAARHERSKSRSVYANGYKVNYQYALGLHRL